MDKNYKRVYDADSQQIIKKRLENIVNILNQHGSK
jgi:hypothetical protein